MKGDAKLLREIKEIVRATGARDEKSKLAAIGLLREKLIPGMPCPQCGNPIDWREAGTHIRTGYRSPCPQPNLPGSWDAERDVVEMES